MGTIEYTRRLLFRIKHNLFGSTISIAMYELEWHRHLPVFEIAIVQPTYSYSIESTPTQFVFGFLYLVALHHDFGSQS